MIRKHRLRAEPRLADGAPPAGADLLRSRGGLTRQLILAPVSPCRLRSWWPRPSRGWRICAAVRVLLLLGWGRGAAVTMTRVCPTQVPGGIEPVSQQLLWGKDE